MKNQTLQQLKHVHWDRVALMLVSEALCLYVTAHYALVLGEHFCLGPVGMGAIVIASLSVVMATWVCTVQSLIDC